MCKTKQRKLLFPASSLFVLLSLFLAGPAFGQSDPGRQSRPEFVIAEGTKQSANTTISVPVQKPIPKDSPIMKISARMADAGKVIKGRSASFAFTIENKGKSDLVIESVKPSCGCTVTKYDPTIAPGGQGKLTATIDTSRFKGPIKKMITIISNDPYNPQLQVELSATIIPLVDIQDRENVFGKVYRGEGFTKELTLRSTTEEPLKLSNVKSTNEFVAAELMQLVDREKEKAKAKEKGKAKKPAAKKGSDEKGAVPETNPEEQMPDYKLTIGLSPKAPIGSLGAEITIDTNYTELPQIKIPVNIMVEGNILINPEKLYLGTLKKSDLPLLRRSIGIQKRIGEPNLKIKKVESDIPSLKLETTTIEEGKNYTIEITVPGEVTTGKVEGKILIHTTDPFQPVIEIPVIGIFT